MNSIPISTSTTSFGSTETIVPESEVDKQAFLNLLVTQLKNQDPLSPTQNEEFLAQLATFSQLEETQNTTALLEDLVALSQATLTLNGLSQGASLVGHNVDYIDPISGERHQGMVDRVTFDPTGVVVEIGGKVVPAGSIISIASGPTASQPEPTEPTAPPVAPPSQQPPWTLTEEQPE